MQKIARSAFNCSAKAPIVRTLKLSTVAAVKGGAAATAKGRGIMRVFDRFNPRVAEEAEKTDIKTLEDFSELTRYFREFRVPVNHPINDVAERIRALRSIKGSSTVKDIQEVRQFSYVLMCLSCSSCSHQLNLFSK